MIGVPFTHASPVGRRRALPLSWPWDALQTWAAVLVTLPVFVQAPWVRASPFSATLFTLPLLLGALLLERFGESDQRRLGALLVGFCGSWLGGCLFWGWFRLHPVCHLPIEAFALPLALGGLSGRWRLAAGFYLASLLGTAATDIAIAATGLMPFWPSVLQAAPEQAASLLFRATSSLGQPASLLILVASALLLLGLGRWLHSLGQAGRVAAAALTTTLLVDGLFVAAARMAPALSGLI
ncbi:MAG: DUF3120 domain-containing protein [Synechococcaceae cyanobacterium]|nr:DUF3120 domain-containing protein [Synechococcaceae cyanobacterium]